MAQGDFQSATATPAVNAGSTTDGTNALTAHRLGGVVRTTATVSRALGGAVLAVKGNAGAVAARVVLASGLSHLIPTPRTVKAILRVARVPNARIRVVKVVARTPLSSSRKAAGGLVRIHTMWTARAGRGTSSWALGLMAGTGTSATSAGC